MFKTQQIIPKCFLWLISILFLNTTATCQTAANDLETTIFKYDSLFWIAYNQCDIEGMNKFIADDVEFYHDKGGIMNGIEAFTNSTRKNLCGNNDYRVRREAKPGTVHIYPMMSNNEIYGAIISGEHYFYINQKGKAEYRSGLARFTHLWTKESGTWKMKRILSYDHKPADQ